MQGWLFGLVQGVTEFLPVSSSGHLVLLSSWLGTLREGGVLEIGAHLGTLVAIVAGYRETLATWGRELLQGRSWARHHLYLLVVASIPAAVVGLALDAWILRWFTPQAAAVGWLATTVSVWATPPPSAGRQTLDQWTWREALLVGMSQVLALWPGLSRSGATIMAARRLGLTPEEAARFSFLMALVAVCGAVLLHASDLWAQPRLWLAPALWAAGFGWLALRWVRQALTRQRSYAYFGWYTLALALVAWWTGDRG
ncbi:MAG: undecaprenyl-diphosphate phosphatase [Firmicutes bacterium]|nr:undecaprenyl-diphosphate phosphatase [Bacillota bacterium]